MKKCTIAMENLPSCGKDICCFHCDEQKTCDVACNSGYYGCECLIEEETDLQVMESAVPEAVRIITEITVQMKKMEEQQKLMKQKLCEAMEKYGVKKFENAQVSFTYVAPTTKTSIDSAKLKKLHPDIAEECSKTSNVASYVKVQVK